MRGSHHCSLSVQPGQQDRGFRGKKCLGAECVWLQVLSSLYSTADWAGVRGGLWSAGYVRLVQGLYAIGRQPEVSYSHFRRLFITQVMQVKLL